MAWEYRNSRRYYYRSERVNGRVQKEYVGTGQFAEYAAALDYYDRLNRLSDEARDHADRAADAATDTLIRQYCAEVSRTVAAVLTAAGYHRHERGAWRKRRDTMKHLTDADKPQTALAVPDAHEARTAAIKAGHKAPAGSAAEVLALECVERIRTERGDLRFSDTFHASMFEKPENDTRLNRALVQLIFDKACTELAGPNPTRLEKLLIERIAVCQAHPKAIEAAYVQRIAKNMSPEQALFLEKRLSMAQRRYLDAIKALAQIRRLPPIQVNIGRNQVNVAQATPTPAPCPPAGQ